jgi:hypothetical protein
MWVVTPTLQWWRFSFFSTLKLLIPVGMVALFFSQALRTGHRVLTFLLDCNTNVEIYKNL